jgi:hypothetical protein
MSNAKLAWHCHGEETKDEIQANFAHSIASSHMHIGTDDGEERRDVRHYAYFCMER